MTKSETQPDKHGEEQTVEQKLADILQLLNPPKQQYGELAARAANLLPFLLRPSIECALARYFELFAAGYAEWQGNYNYPRIHEYFYGAHLQAVQEGGSSLSPELDVMLEQMTLAMIAYTDCENALICNDPKGLFDSAKRAAECGTAALQSLDQSSLRPPLREPIQQYLQMNVDLWTGFKLCAEMYLAPLKNEKVPDATPHEVKEKLESLEVKSRELASELRAYFSFAQRLAQAHAHRNSDLRVKEATLLLRATGHVGEKLIAKLSKDIGNSDTMPEKKLEKVCELTGLRILAIRSEPIEDIFGTNLGEEYLKQIIFDLSTELSTDDKKHALTFTILEGESERVYPVETFQVRVTGFGTISVEFEISIEDASVSHVRVLNSILAPYAGRFEFIWPDAPSNIGRESTNFVEYFLKSHEWLQSIQNATPHNLSFTVAEMKNVLEKWREALCELAECLLPRSTKPLDGAPEQAELPEHDPKAPREQAESPAERVYRTLHEECFLGMREKAWQWIQEYKTSDSLEKLVQAGNRLFPPGVRYGQLIDIADEVLKHIKIYLSSKVDLEKDTNGVDANLERLPLVEDLEEEDFDVGHLYSFDPNTGWATILLCTRLIVVEHNGREIEPVTESDYYRVAAHPEFKGFIIQPREARSGLFDWLFVAAPAYRNLATIRSHETDAMYIGENHTFLYLPDDPQFLTDQYIDTVRLMDDIRILARSFNTIAKKQIDHLEDDFRSMRDSESSEDTGMSISKSYDSLRLQRDKIEDFRTHAEQILDLIRSTTIARYQDHGELLKEMIKESRLDDIRISLEHNITDLDRFHAYLTERLRRKIDEISETTQRRIETTQRRLNYLLVILTFLSALAIIPLFVDIPDLRKFLVSLPGRMLGFIELLGMIIGRNILLFFIVVLLVAVLLGTTAVSLIIHKKNRKT